MSSGRLSLLLGSSLCVIAVASVGIGSTDVLSFGEALRGALHVFGFGDPLPRFQAIADLRVSRVGVGIGVGAALALSGALLQGVFRNDLASPSIIGVSSGASLGASLVILAIGGYGPRFLIEAIPASGQLLISTGAFASALLVVWLVTRVATIAGRVSVPTLLLVGVAVNAVSAGLIAAIQSLALADYQISQALFSWLFGRLEDRSTFQAFLLLIGVVTSAACIPFVAREMDLLATGEDDAETLGVDTARLRRRAILAASLSAALAVSIAGQVGFVGLIVPHLLRRLVGGRHAVLLPMCVLGGPTLLLGADLLQRLVAPSAALPPGVMMSLLGGPFFLYLLVRNRTSLRGW